MLASFQIQNFRAFQRLEIERLGQVNLIVGKNNVGKSTLLEALRLYAHQGASKLIAEILSLRDELNYTFRAEAESDEPSGLNVVRLFYEPQNDEKISGSIKIGPSTSNEILQISLELHVEQIDAEGRRLFRRIDPAPNEISNGALLALTIRFGSQTKDIIPEGQSLLGQRPRMESKAYQEVNCLYISAKGLGQTRIGSLWDKITLTDLEQEILYGLKIIAPEAEKISLIGETSHRPGRIAIVKTSGQLKPVSLSSMGDGMNRIFGIILALVNAKDGMLLIDEIENGIHYTVQPELWTTIFKVAQRLNVQVFATTHSWDCISAFQQAMRENPQQDGLLIRLETKKDKTEAVLFDKNELGIVSRDLIEVR